jgi:hypothetical protein
MSFHLTGQDADSLSRQMGGFDRSATGDHPTRNGSGARGETDPGDDASLPSPSPMRWQRVGLDITA